MWELDNGQWARVDQRLADLQELIRSREWDGIFERIDDFGSLADESTRASTNFDDPPNSNAPQSFLGRVGEVSESVKALTRPPTSRRKNRDAEDPP